MPSTTSDTLIYDAIVLGGGPAGISCALELHENRVRCLLLDRNQRLGGQLEEIQNTIRNFAARFWESGAALRDDMETLCKTVNLSFRLNEAIIKADLSKKELYSAQSCFKFRTLFIATGTRLRELPIERGNEFASHITWRLEGYEAQLAGKPVAVVGGGDNALMNSAILAQTCPQVLLIHRSDRFRARQDVIDDVMSNQNITVLPYSEVLAAEGEGGTMRAIQVRNLLSNQTTRYPTENVVINVGTAPNSELFLDQLKVGERGFIDVDKNGWTGVDGVFAGGDITSPDCHGIAIGVGEGMVAARAMIGYLRKG